MHILTRMCMCSHTHTHMCARAYAYTKQRKSGRHEKLNIGTVIIDWNVTQRNPMETGSMKQDDHGTVILQTDRVKSKREAKRILCLVLALTWGRDSVVGIGTCYGLEGPGIESRWESRFSAPVQTDPRAHPASYTMGTRTFSLG